MCIQFRTLWPCVRRALLAAACAAAAAAPAQAQLGLPRVNLPSLPRELPRLPSEPLPEMLQANVALQALRRSTVDELLRNHADLVEADPAGEPIRRQELLLVSPTPAVVDAALAMGLVVVRERDLQALALREVVLRTPQGVATAEALSRLRALDPQLEADFNHLYTRSGEPQIGAAAPTAAHAAPAARRVGLVDGGVERRHPALRHAAIEAWGCSGTEVPSAHGTAVASLLVGRDGAFTGVSPGSTLYAADIYCDQAAGGAVEDIALALAWMAEHKVAVVNISLVGPANRLLERAVQAMSRQGHLIVAAVGNDGPAAPPLYPASYAGVVGVTGVWPTRRVLPEAAQGPQVALAAPGAELAVARTGGGYAVARGTSFAAPLVAGILAERHRAPDVASALAAVRAVVESAQDLGEPGRDPVYGAGLVAERSRVAPDVVQARAR